MVTGTFQALLEAWDRAPCKLTVRFPQLPLSLCLEHQRRRRWVSSSGLADRHSWSDWQCLRGDWGVTDSKCFYTDSNWRQRHVASFLLLVLLVALSDPTQSKCSLAHQFLSTCCSVYVHYTHSCFFSFSHASSFHFCSYSSPLSQALIRCLMWSCYSFLLPLSTAILFLKKNICM